MAPQNIEQLLFKERKLLYRIIPFYIIIIFDY